MKKTLLDIQNIGAANYTALGLVEKYSNIQLEVRRALDSLDLITRWHDYMVVSPTRIISLNVFTPFDHRSFEINWFKRDIARLAQVIAFAMSVFQTCLLLLEYQWKDFKV